MNEVPPRFTTPFTSCVTTTFSPISLLPSRPRFTTPFTSRVTTTFSPHFVGLLLAQCHPLASPLPSTTHAVSTRNYTNPSSSIMTNSDSPIRSRKRAGDSLLDPASKRVQTSTEMNPLQPLLHPLLCPTSSRPNSFPISNPCCQQIVNIAPASNLFERVEHPLSLRLLCPRANHPHPRAKRSKPAPAWFSNSLSMLQANEPPLGDRWAELTRLWSKFEEKEGFKQRKKLGTKAHPPFIAEWIRNARSPTGAPRSRTFLPSRRPSMHGGKDCNQSGELSEDRLTILDKTDGDWDQLRRPGLNGILSIMACLFYWGCKAQGNMKHCAGWASAVEDCILVLGQVI
jgi:hypothetical protein